MAHDSGYARRFLGLLVKQAREEKEWDQQYLADELDIDIRTLRKIEAGKSNIGYNLLIKIIHSQRYRFAGKPSGTACHAEGIRVLGSPQRGDCRYP